MEIGEFCYTYLFYYFTLLIEVYVIVLLLSNSPYNFIYEHSLQIFAKRVSLYFLSISSHTYINLETYPHKEIHLALNIYQFLRVWPSYMANTTQGHEDTLSIIDFLILPHLSSYYFWFLIFHRHEDSLFGSHDG